MGLQFGVTSAGKCAVFRADDPAACRDHEFHDVYVFYEAGPDGQQVASPEGWPEFAVGAAYDPPATMPAERPTETPSQPSIDPGKSA